MKRITTRILAFIGIAAIAGAIYAFSSNEEKTDEQVSFKTVKVGRDNISASVLATGIIKPQVGSEVKIGSRASGTVTELYVNIGDWVTKGQLLAELDDKEYQSQSEQAKANLKYSEVNLKYAEIEYHRIKNLKEKNFTSQQALDEASKAFELSKAKNSQNKANLDFNNIQLAYTKIHAPISGVIGSVSTQKGETVAATITAPTFVTIVDLNRLEVQTYVDETDIGRIKVGQKASFTVDTYTNTEFKGIVTAIYPQAAIRNNVVNYIVLVEFENIEGKILRPEMTASVNIYTVNRENVIALSKRLIKRKNSKTIVRLLENNKVVEREVILGTKGQYKTEIIEGIEEGDNIIIN